MRVFRNEQRQGIVDPALGQVVLELSLHRNIEGIELKYNQLVIPGVTGDALVARDTGPAYSSPPLRSNRLPAWGPCRTRYCLQ